MNFFPGKYRSSTREGIRDLFIGIDDDSPSIYSHRFFSATNDVTRNLDICAPECAVACACTRVERRDDNDDDREDKDTRHLRRDSCNVRRMHVGEGDTRTHAHIGIYMYNMKKGCRSPVRR